MTESRLIDKIKNEFDSSFDEETKASLKLSEDGYGFHFTIGMWLRNNWHLWEFGNEIVDFFNSKGIYHADDMSGIILKTYIQILKSEPIDLTKQIKYYKDYWKKQGIDIKKETLAQRKRLKEKIIENLKR